MNRLIKHRVITFLLIYLVGMGIVSFALFNWYSINTHRYIQNEMHDFNEQINSYQSMQEKMMDNYYGLFLDDHEVGNIMSQAMISDEQTRHKLREKLMAKTLPMFKSLKNYETRLVFFHLPGQIAFLRLHKPEKFGDSLTKKRPSVVEAQKNQTKLSIFETGKLFDGFRSIYPIFHHGMFVGTVEIAYPFLAIKNQALQQMPGAYTFLIKRSLQESKSTANVISQTYQKSPFGQRYYEDKESSLKQGMKLFSNQEIDQLIDRNRLKIQDALSEEKEQALVLKYMGKNALMILRPVKELHGNHAAYMVQITPNHIFFDHERERLIMLWFTVAILFALLLWYIYRYNRSLIVMEQYKKAMDENLIVSKTDEKGFITYANDRFAEISGYKIEELIGKPHNIIRHPNMPSSVFKEVWETIQNGKIWYGMIQNRKKSGESYYVNSTICPILDENGKIIEYIGLREDITELVEANQRADELRKRAEKSESAKMEFLANMSHEIRTPLNGILGFAKLLQDAKLPTDQHRQATIIVEQSKTLMGVINDILDLSKIESGNMQLDPVEINTYFEFENAFGLFIPLAKDKKIDYSIDLDEHLAESFVIDILRLKQVMTNLISNALKFTPEGGSIVITIHVLEDKENVQKVHFSVSDTGIGINPEKIATIFSPFIQEDNSTTRQFGGTGLGLSISSTLVKMFGGELNVESEKGKGSRFWFDIEVSKGSISQKLTSVLEKENIVLVPSNTSKHYQKVKEQLDAFNVLYSEYEVQKIMTTADHKRFTIITFEPDAAQTLSALEKEIAQHIILVYTNDDSLFGDGVIVIDAFERCPFRLYTTLYGLQRMREHKVVDGTAWSGKKVLIAEDYEVNRILMESLLESFGIIPDFAENGRIACEMVEQTHYDLVLMDINMPEMDGIEATRFIRQYNRELPIVALTANALEGDRERFMSEGMNSYLTKPIVMDRLLKILEEYLDGDIVHQASPKAQSDKDDFYKDAKASLGLPEAVLNKLYDSFASTIPGKIDQLEAALRDKNLTEAASLVHTIKGSAANLFIKSMSDLAIEIEKNIKSEQLDDAQSLTSRLKEEYEIFLHRYEIGRR